MSIINSYDEERCATINLEDALPKSKQILDVCIINFSYKIMDALIENDLLSPIEDIPAIKSVACLYNVYTYKNCTFRLVRRT